jgi:formylglycine-generating enzyme required for sulfatase activity
LDNCGTNGTESCCASLEVEGGTYDRTYDLDDSGVAILSPEGGPTGEADPATVSGFRLDKYLVTVGRFRKFVAAVTPTDAGPAGYEPEAGSGKHAYLNGGDGLENSASPGTHEPGWDPTDDVNVTPTDSALGSCASTGTSTWTPQAALNENNPINCVNWQESYAFCIWDGGFLPSEAELEYAAAGGGGADGQREYPWGSIDPASGSNADSYAVYNSDSNTEPVGTSTLGVGRWGQLDLAGQLWEWTLDWKAAYSASCTDCAYFSLTSPGRSVRGGNYTNPEIWLHPSRRFSSAPLDRDFGNGVRCARAP